MEKETMDKEKASKHFNKKPERYNCAQAILLAFQDDYNIEQKQIKAYKSCGHGRVEGGMCGALFAAKVLLGDSDHTEELERCFCEAAGSVKCREILKLKRIPCDECVDVAEALLQDFDKLRTTNKD